ncbi:phage tail tube protein [Sporomusa malonica]|uniref:VCBS repeat-containing protein n=1 Tax=Sporomusa malonica TaxID=112901 RepID=A0A1W2AR42_9FIRM|nr:phage tail tube protein [Sporomusa malonica]SMC63219.1 VCBS repeat-containing protein [Sporomusa malonica]
MPEFKLKNFDLQLCAVTLPDNPDTSSATVGKDYLLYVNGGTASIPVWKIVGGQRSSNLNRSADSVDLSHKTSGGWKTTKQGLKGWGIDLDAIILLEETGYEEGVAIIEAGYMQGKDINIKLVYPNGLYRTGWTQVTDFPEEAPHDGEASLSGTLEGVGALSNLLPDLTPITATMSLAAAADKVFTILPATTTVSSVKNGSTAITVTTDYTYSTGTLTLLSGYLDGLTAGAYTFTVTTGDGATLTVTVTITA